MSAAEKMGSESVSDLRKFMRPIGAFEAADTGTMAELMAAYIVCDANSLEELLDRLLTAAAERLEDEVQHPVFEPRHFASKEAWHAAGRRRSQILQEVLFARTLLRRCFAEGVLKEKL